LPKGLSDAPWRKIVWMHHHDFFAFCRLHAKARRLSSPLVINVCPQYQNLLMFSIAVPFMLRIMDFLVVVVFVLFLLGLLHMT
jgi:hypothetical protein